ncbi:PREDICTED: taste receptor type 2 member 1-like [Elephantulus edwardii]|uniref:taste receptor type 2 member 1-like n=1 Tax=Elephantulus edwardii TaxID=28737 RepID=UPI0003F07C94|nr:PREDICTED: taste receptor type 2 member 1-like [Elephantulus edwardii]
MDLYSDYHNGLVVKMLDVQLFLCLLLSVAQLLSGILANGIILAGNGIDLVKRKMWNSLSLLLSCLAIVRIIIQVLFFYMALAFLSLVEFPMVERYFVVCMFIEELGLWFATWLGVFYCAKIANISHPIFFWLKRRISKLVPWLILGSVLYASVILIGHSQHTSKIFKQILLSFLSNNGTNQNKQDFAYPYTIFIIGLSLPLFIFLTAVLLLVISLGRHTRQMRLSKLSLIRKKPVRLGAATAEQGPRAVQRGRQAERRRRRRRQET